jgi:hypothetical protein
MTGRPQPRRPSSEDRQATDLGLHRRALLSAGCCSRQLGAAGVTGLKLYSMLVATIGAVVVLSIYQLWSVAGSRERRQSKPGRITLGRSGRRRHVAAIGGRFGTRGRRP